MQAEKNLINIFYDNLTIDNFYKELAEELQSDYIKLSWLVIDKYYTYKIYEKGKIIEENKYEDDIKTDLYVIEFGNCKICLDKNKEISPTYKFIMHQIANKLYLEDMKKRNKFKKTMMLSNTSHSIKTPLNGILEITDSLLENNKNNKNNKMLLYLNKLSLDLANNIMDIIDIYKIELGSFVLKKDIFSLRELSNNIKSFTNSVYNKSIIDNVKINFVSTLNGLAYGDDKRIYQIICNFVNNSMKNTNNGFISIKLECFDQNISKSNGHINLIVDIIDSSSIIPDKEIFMPYEMYPKKNNMYYIYKLCLLVDGNIKIIPSNKGTHFQLIFKLLREKLPKYANTTLKLLQEKKVLIISQSNILDICKFLEKYKMTYTCVLNDEESANLFDKKFDIIIYDNKSKVKDLKELWNQSIFIRVDDELLNDASHSSQLNNDECISLPIDEFIFRKKLISAFKKRKKDDIKQYNILIAEDNKINRIVIKKQLNKEGFYNLTLAKNGEEVYQIFRDNPKKYKIILLDIRMPIMDGFQAAKKIYEICLENHILIPKMIGITAQLIDERNIKDYFDTFVSKPISIKKLLTMINYD